MRYIKEDRLLKIVCFCFLLSACNTFDKNGNSLSGFSEDGFEELPSIKNVACIQRFRSKSVRSVSQLAHQ